MRTKAHQNRQRVEPVDPAVRAYLLDAAFRFIDAIRGWDGIRKIALIGSMTTDKPDPKAKSGASKSVPPPAPKVEPVPPVEPYEMEGSAADHVAALLGESQAGATKSARVLSEAAAMGVPVRLSVIATNPALDFYLSHGFRIHEETSERRIMTT